jgi:nitrate/TMAO reductase-like tetraheme cytochrome c subunit
MFSRLFPLTVFIAALCTLWAGCSDSADTPDASPAQSQNSSQIFPYSHNPALLVRTGPDACVNCHQQAVEDWQQSHHAKANRPVSVRRDAAAFTPSRRIQESGVTYEMVQIGEAFKLRVVGEDGIQQAEYNLVGVIGETPLRQYLAHLPGNKFQTISATYDVLNDQWVDVFSGQDRMPDEWGHWQGQGMNWNANCAYCHTTEYEKGFDYKNNLYQSTWIQQGIACAECHSGLDAHLEAAQAGDYTSGLTHLDAVQTKENCQSCHSRRDQLTADAFSLGDRYDDHFALSLPDQPGLYYPDGQILDEVFVHASFEMSRMGHAGVTCADCHKPHTLEQIMPVANNMLCMRCHEAGVDDAPIIEPVKHSFHSEGSTGNQCVECHMSETVYMQVDWRADHGFHSPDPLMTKELDIPNACNKCHTEESVDWAVEHAESWYGEKLEASRQRQRARAVSKAYVYDPAALPELVALAEAEDIPAWQATYTGLIANYLPSAAAEAHLRSQLGHESQLVRTRATSGLAMVASGRELLLDQLKDESRSVRIAASRGLASRNQDVTDPVAAKEWAEYLNFNADRPQSLLMQANQAARESRPADALDYVRRATQLDEANPEMYHQGAILLSTAGLNKEARIQLFAGWERAPEDPRFPYSLGLLAAETGDLKSAAGYLEETVAMAPDFYRAWYNLSLAYTRLNRPEDAQRAMQKAQGQ